MKKMNCWEFKKCGREHDGVKSSLGVCPAASVENLDGIHDGKYAGRACWVVAGTSCEVQERQSFARMNENCGHCDFYTKVKQEEGASFLMTVILLHKAWTPPAHPTKDRETSTCCGVTWKENRAF